MKTEHELLSAAGDYIAKHGFSPKYRVSGTECGCFIHAVQNVWDNDLSNDSGVLDAAVETIEDITGSSLTATNLRFRGWTGPEVTQDAAAACYIAADIAEAEGR